MRRILAIDPGTRELGWALFNHGQLRFGGVLRAKTLEEMLFRVKVHDWGQVEELVVERPEIYPDSKANPNEILNIALVAGACIGATDHDSRILPRPKTWKGQVPKAVHHARILAKLDDKSAKRAREIAAKHGTATGRQDFLDAVGLGVWRLNL